MNIAGGQNFGPGLHRREDNQVAFRRVYLLARSNRLIDDFCRCRFVCRLRCSCRFRFGFCRGFLCRPFLKTAAGQQGQGSSPGKPALIVVGGTYANHVNVVAAAGPDHLEKVEFAVQAFVFLQADNQRDVFEEARRLADLVPEIGLEFIVVEVIKLKGCQGNTGTFQLKALFCVGGCGIAHGWTCSPVSEAWAAPRARSGGASKRMPDQPVLINWRMLPWLSPAGSPSTCS